MTARLLATLLFVICLGLPAQGLGQSDLMPGPTATIASVVDGDTVVLKTPVLGASQIRLVGIQAPKLTLGRKNFPTWPLAAESKKALENLALGKTVTLSFGVSDKDRYGRLLAHLHRPDGTWVQDEMLKKGMARVYSFADNRARVGRMLALESEARAARIKGRVYFNFSDDWKTDFTVTIGVPARRMFREAGTDPLSLEGKRIRVRG